MSGASANASARRRRANGSLEQNNKIIKNNNSYLDNNSIEDNNSIQNNLNTSDKLYSPIEVLQIHGKKILELESIINKYSTNNSISNNIDTDYIKNYFDTNVDNYIKKYFDTNLDNYIKNYFDNNVDNINRTNDSSINFDKINEKLNYLESSLVSSDSFDLLRDDFMELKTLIIKNQLNHIELNNKMDLLEESVIKYRNELNNNIDKKTNESFEDEFSNLIQKIFKENNSYENSKIDIDNSSEYSDEDSGENSDEDSKSLSSNDNNILFENKVENIDKSIIEIPNIANDTLNIKELNKDFLLETDLDISEIPDNDNLLLKETDIADIQNDIKNNLNIIKDLIKNNENNENNENDKNNENNKNNELSSIDS